MTKNKANPRKMTNGIRRTSDLKRWEGTVFTGEYNESGKPVYEWVTGDSRKEVERKRDDLIYQINHGRFVRRNKNTLGDFLDDWLEVYKTNIAITTYELYLMYVRKHIKPTIGKVPLQDIMPMTLQKFYNDKLETQSPNTVRKYHSFISNALAHAKTNRLIIDNPAEYVTLPRKVKFEPKIPTKEQFFKLLDKTKNTPDEIYIILAGGLGMRRGEVLGLRWSDIDFKRSTISINSTITRFSTVIEKDPKNESSKRTIQAPRFVMDVLDDYRRKKKIIGLDNLVCDAYTPQAYSNHFKRVARSVGLDDLRFHDLRHFAAVILMLKKVPDKMVAEMLGHSNVSTLKETYQHVIDELRTQTADVMDDFLTSRK